MPVSVSASVSAPPPSVYLPWMRRAAALSSLSLALACGARTELYAPEPSDASTVDSAPPRDASCELAPPPDVSCDASAPTLRAFVHDHGKGLFVTADYAANCGSPPDLFDALNAITEPAGIVFSVVDLGYATMDLDAGCVADFPP